MSKLPRSSGKCSKVSPMHTLPKGESFILWVKIAHALKAWSNYVQQTQRKSHHICLKTLCYGD